MWIEDCAIKEFADFYNKILNLHKYTKSMLYGVEERC